MIACPPDDALKAFIAEQLPSGEQAAIAGHVNECLRCRQTLEQWLHAVPLGLPHRPVPDRPAECRPDPAFVQFVIDHPPFVIVATAEASANNEPLDAATHRAEDAWPTVPEYEILGELGRGGMGVVYQALQQSLNRLVALKVVHRRRLDDAEWLRRFRAEAKAIGRLQHPHIVQIHDVLERDGQPVLVLEFCAGGSLAQRLAGSPLSDPESAALASKLARAIDHAHQHGILHLDLKPANVLFTAAGEPKITDFGLARSTAGDPRQTPTGVVAGTPSYMAPEQIRGGPGSGDPRVDVYGLGATLYEMLTGHPPFQADTSIATARKVVEQPLVPPSRLRPNVCKDLEAICVRCLEKDPRRRYPNARGLADDFNRLLHPVPAPPPWASRRFVILGIAAAGLCLPLLAWAGRRWGPFHSRPGSPTTSDHRSPLLLTASRVVANAHRGDVYAVAISPDGSQVLSGGWDMRLRLWDAADGKPLQPFIGHTNNVNDVAFSPDGRVAISCCGGPNDNHADLWDVATGQHLRRFEGHTDRVESVALSSNGERALSGSWDGTMRLWETKTGRELHCFCGHSAGVNAVRFSLGGGMALSASGDHTVRLWHLTSKKEVRRFEGHTSFVWDAAFSPDGRRIVSAGWDSQVFLWDAEGDQESLCISGHTDEVNAVAFAPDGRRFLSASKDRTVRLWDAQTGQELARLEGHRSNVHCVAFSPDGRWAVSGSQDRSIRWWQFPE